MLTSLQAAAAKLREHAVPVRVVESQTEAKAMTYWDASGREWVVGDTYYLIHLAPCGHKNTQSVSEPDGTLFRCLDCGAGRK